MKKKRKNKFSIKKFLKGFTLVELLAVIVILAIIMIIAIPAVLDTMEASKKKSFIMFAQKAMNEAEKQFLTKQTLGEINTYADTTYFYFDIKKDLGLNNTGNYEGVVVVGISNYDGVFKEIKLYDGKYTLGYSSWRNLYELDEDDVKTYDITQLPSTYDYSNIEWKKIYAVTHYCSLCNWDEFAHIDAATNTKMFENTPSHRYNYTGDVCNDEETDYKLFDNTLVTYFINNSQIGNCDYIRNLS